MKDESSDKFNDIKKNARKRLSDQKSKFELDNMLRLYNVSAFELIREVFERVVSEDAYMINLMQDIRREKEDVDLLLPPRLSEQYIYELLSRLSPINAKGKND